MVLMNNFFYPIFTGKRVHIGVSGSIAAYKSLELMRLLQKQGINISVTLTKSATEFITPLSYSSLGAERVYDEIFSNAEKESPYSHLDPGAVSHAFVIAPATASTISRLATGMADDMLSAQALAFNRQLVIAPAMNPRMWSNSATQDNIKTLKKRGHEIVGPDTGTVACGEQGCGKLSSVEEICWHTLRAICRAKGMDLLKGKKILVTMGPTREQWDGVRFWSNLSTGYMGASLAIAAWLRGAEVHAVAGPGVPEMPKDIILHSVLSAQDMYEKADALWDSSDVGIFTAAVADFSPQPFGKEKFKKTGQGEGFSIKFEANKDILASLASRKTNNQRVMGFAAETSDLEKRTREKMKSKNADILVGNKIGEKGTGFGSLSNDVFICRSEGSETRLPRMNKPELAWLLLDKLCGL